jgi:hypothetical protein
MDDVRYGRIQLLAGAAMEISWLFSWASLVMGLLSEGLFPYLQAVIAFGTGALLARETGKRGWRRIWMIAVHLTGFSLATLLLFHAFTYTSMPLFNRVWIVALFALPQNATDWFIFVLLLLWATAFYVSGMKLAERQRGYWTACTRFDLGILMFAGLLLFRLGLAHNGAPVEGRTTGWMVIVFVISGLFTIGLARNRRQAGTTYLAGRRMTGVLLSYTFAVMLCVVGLTALLWPFFVTTAETGYGLLQQGFRPVASLLVWLLRFLFLGKGRSTNPAGGYPGEGMAEKLDIAAATDGPGLLAAVMWWAFAGVVAIAIAGLTGFVLWRLVEWLLGRSPADRRTAAGLPGFFDWLSGLSKILIFCADWVVHRLRARTEIGQVFAALLRWGEYGGVARDKNETVREYARRLCGCFPAAKPDIVLIADLFERAVYAGQQLDCQQLSRADRAMRRLRHPSYWPARILCRLGSDPKERRDQSD